MDESNQEGDAIAADAPHVVDVEAKPAVDAPAYASMTFDERLAGYNAENEATLKKYGIVLGAEAYIVDGLIRSRPVAVPIEQSTLKANG